MNNKFRINLHSAFYDPEILWGSADNTKKDPNEKKAHMNHEMRKEFRNLKKSMKKMTKGN